MLEFMGIVALVGFGLGAAGIGVGWFISYLKERKFRKFLEED